MNSIALFHFLMTVAVSGQVGMGATTPGVQYGWKQENDGSLSYIVQISREVSEQIAVRSEEIAVDIPDFLQGRIQRVVWRVGTAQVEREPSEAELRANPPRQVLPRSAENSFAPGTLTHLNDTAAGQPVMIDRQGTGSLTFPTSSTGRATDSEGALPAVPSLAQNYASPSARMAQNTQMEPPRSSFTGTNAPNAAGSGTYPVLPRTDTMPSTSPPFIGPQLPPAGYTGSSVTVHGTSNGWSDPRGTSTINQSGASNPFSSGTFGTSPSLGMGSNSSSYAPPTPGFSSSTAPPYNNQTYPNPSQTYPNGYAAPTSNYGSPAYGTNGSQTTYPPTMAPPTNSPWTSTNPPPNPYGSMMTQNGTYPTTYPQMASTAPIPTAATRSMADPNKRTTTLRDEPPIDSLSTSSPNFVSALLLLISFVVNLYLVWLLSQLLQRYRALQASSRGASSLAV